MSEEHLTGPERLEPERLRAILELWRATGKRSIIRVVGGSMYPVLRNGWDLVVEHAEVEHRFGTVIVFQLGRMLVAHRVVGRFRTGSYLTKGDALLHLDRRPVLKERVVGRVVALNRKGQQVSMTGLLSGGLGFGIAVTSRLMGEINGLLRPLRRSTWPSGKLFKVLPGPTRILRVMNRLVMALAARLGGMGYSSSDGPGAGSDSSSARGGGS